MFTFGALRELTNGYLFILDAFFVSVLVGVLLSDPHDRPSLAAALIIYLTGHALERWWLWNWWGTKAHIVPDDFWNELTLIRYDPTLIISLVLVTIGLTWCVFILMTYWGRWSWVIAIILAILIPIALLFYH
jgi:hypothetical protein